ncbi:hypothetical protein ACQ4PT_042553 [Festuca glaucescens]
MVVDPGELKAKKALCNLPILIFRQKKSRKEEHQVSSARVRNGLNSTKVRVNKRKAGSTQRNSAGSNHGQFEGRSVSSASHAQTHRGNQPLFERPQQPPPLREVGNAWQPRMDGRSIACPNPTMGFEHPNAAPAGWRAPPPNQPGVIFPPFNMLRTMYKSHPDRAYVMPQYRYSGSSNGFPR